MKIKTMKVLAGLSFGASISLMVAGYAMAEGGGGSVGNGGGAMFCLMKKDGTRRVRLLDLVEAESGVDAAGNSVPALTILHRDDISRARQLSTALDRLAAYAPELVARMRDVLERKAKRVDVAKRLPPPTDTKIQFMRRDPDCEIEALLGVARYHDDTDVLEIDPELLARMSQTDQAALDFHEALYKVFRDGVANAQDSIAARKLTGAIFAQEDPKFVSVGSGTESADYLCTSEKRQYTFYMTNLPNGRVRFQFTRIEGYVPFGPVVYTSRYSATLDRPINGKEMGKVIAERASHGFMPYHHKVKGQLHTRGYYNAFAGGSSYEPDFNFELIVHDVSTQCDTPAASCTASSAWADDTLFVNASVVLRPQGAAPYEGDTVGCVKL